MAFGVYDHADNHADDHTDSEGGGGDDLGRQLRSRTAAPSPIPMSEDGDCRDHLFGRYRRAVAG